MATNWLPNRKTPHSSLSVVGSANFHAACTIGKARERLARVFRRGNNSLGVNGNTFRLNGRQPINFIILLYRSHYENGDCGKVCVSQFRAGNCVARLRREKSPNEKWT